MTPVRLWSPHASLVELVCGDLRRPLRRVADGWWEGALPTFDSAYGFLVDGVGPLADPRAAALPDGVYGLSRQVDHTAFAWRDAGWQPPPWPTAIVYELHVGTFAPGGTFAAAIPHLPHLLELGVTHVELMPVHAAPGRRGWGYDAAGLYAVHPAYGGPTMLKQFVDACHAHGIAVLLDVVYNHFGPSGSSAPCCGPYLSPRHQTPWGNALNFDAAEHDEVRRFVCDNALMWLRDYHLDGLRLDAVHNMPDDSPRHIVAQLADEVGELAATLGRPLLLIAESESNDARLVRPRAAGGVGLDAMWNDDFHHAVHAVLTGDRGWVFQDYGSLADIATALRCGLVYQGQHSAFRARPHGTPAEGIRGAQLVAFLQNHDQIGNRACGERLGHLIGPRRMAIGTALLLTAPFVPMLFQGEEWNAASPFLYFTDHQDETLARLVSEGRRAEFGALGWEGLTVPDPQASETFRRSCLDWREPAHGEHAAALEWHRSLIRLRREVPALTALPLSANRVQVDEVAKILVVERGPLTVACNLSFAAHHVPIDPSAGVVLKSDAEIAVEGGLLYLPAESVALALR